jgi:hypothetical protein
MAVTEQHYHENGLIWPRELRPYAYHILIADIEDRYHGCLSEVQIAPYKLTEYIEKFEPVVISKMETVDSSDIASKQKIIEDIKGLLKSPYAHSQFGAITADEAYRIRKDMAECIIDVCVIDKKSK